VSSLEATPHKPTIPFHAREILGTRLRALRDAKGLRLEDVRDQTGASIGELSELERGQVEDPRLAVLLALRELYEAPSLESFFGEVAVAYPTEGISALPKKPKRERTGKV